MPKVGVAILPLDVGRCPSWLFEKMKRLSRVVAIAIIEEFGPEEFLRRLSDPVWFQSFSAVIGMDWNSSGTTAITMGALKEGIKGLEQDLNFYICGGKRLSRKTPEEVEKFGKNLGWEKEKIDKLIYASKIVAKVDSCLIQNPQNPFWLYQHHFIFTRDGKWNVIQQAMSPSLQKARRYHWLSSNLKNYVEEPHSAIVADARSKPLNLVAKESRENKEISLELVKEEPKTFLRDIKLITNKNLLTRRSPNYQVSESSLMKQKRLGNFTEIELYDKEFHWHPVLKEKFDLRRLEKTIFFAHSKNPENFEQLLSLKGIGPKTIRALSLVSEIIYGVKPSYKDPARYSFSVGGKDGTPEFIDRQRYDELLSIMERSIKKAKISNREKIEIQQKLYRQNFSTLIAKV